MRKTEFKDFSAMLEDVAAFYPQAKPPTGDQKAMYFRALSDVTIAQVRAAFDAHLRDTRSQGGWMPLPSHLLEQIARADGGDARPGADEAWAIALSAADEFDTVVWTQEMAEAWAIVLPVFQSGDQIGARVAFRDAYNRLTDAARAARRTVSWTVSEGFDAERRMVAVTRAAEQGRIARDQLPMLPGPANPIALLADAAKAGAPPNAVEAIERFKQRKAARDPLQWARDLKAREGRGEALTMHQSSAWREALEKQPTGQHPSAGSFNPIPDDCLPPGMRKGKR